MIGQKTSLLYNNMQTFLPFPDFKQSAQCLDNKRLGKQRVECLQILKALAKGAKSCKICGNQSPLFTTYHDFCKSENRLHTIINTPWYNHPAVQMWKGFEWQLFEYLDCITTEWVKRGYKDTCLKKSCSIMNENFKASLGNRANWLGNEKFHASHRSSLLAKNFDYYKRFGWTEPSDLPYYWPTKNP